MLKIKDNVDLKELEKFGFIEFKEEYIRHYKSDIATFIDKDTRKIVDVDTDYKFLENLNLGDSKRVNDLIKADLVEKVENDK